MELRLSALGKAKLAIHGIQAILIFISACICIAFFSKKGKTDGRGKYFFALCWLSIPAVIYLTAVPMWERLQKFAKGFIFAAVDIVYTILWLAAFASLISWTREGIRLGAEEKKIPTSQGNCTTFKEDMGVEAKCKLAYSTMGAGVAVFVTFLLTSVISILYLSKQRKEPNSEPWLSVQAYSAPGGIEHGLDNTKQDQIWSTDLEDQQQYGGAAAQHRRSDSSGHTERGTGNKEEDEYELLHGTETEDGHHPGRPWGKPGHLERPYVDTEYHGPATGAYQAPSALSPSGYGSNGSSPRPVVPGGRVDFPTAPAGYDGQDGRYR